MRRRAPSALSQSSRAERTPFPGELRAGRRGATASDPASPGGGLDQGTAVSVCPCVRAAWFWPCPREDFTAATTQVPAGAFMMGSILSRRIAGVEDIDIQANSAYRYPPKSGELPARRGWNAGLEARRGTRDGAGG